MLKKSSHPHTLVILLGNARGGTEAWTTLSEKLLRPLKADLALLFDHTETEQSKQLFSMAKYVWSDRIDFEAVWDSVADFHKIPRYSRDYKLRPQKNIHGPFGGVAGSGGIIAAFREVLRTRHSNTVKKYQRIVLSRSDHFYLCDHPDLWPGKREVLVPVGEEYGGFTDRHAIFNSQDLDRVVNVIPVILRFTTVDFETALKRTWRNNKMKVRKFKRTFFTVFKDNQDSTRWGTPKRNFEWEFTGAGLHPKYPKEINLARKTCSTL
tara:strand:+ start:21772 stop:22569 length:798 start_codon:yes stop_codon:yes gene_type:complete